VGQEPLGPYADPNAPLDENIKIEGGVVLMKKKISLRV
jgi:hypothetical protein